MDGEDVFGCKIKVQFADSPVSASPGPAATSGSDGSPTSCGSKPARKARHDRTVATNSPTTSRACCASAASNDSAVKDDKEGGGGAADKPSSSLGAPASDPRRYYADRRVERTPTGPPCSGDDIVVCGPVEEIDVDMEPPTKDVSACDTGTVSDVRNTPSKKPKKENSRGANKQCKLISVLFCRPVIIYCKVYHKPKKNCATFFELTLVFVD